MINKNDKIELLFYLEGPILFIRISIFNRGGYIEIYIRIEDI